MVRLSTSLRLLTFPLLGMGLVQCAFGLASAWLFRDAVFTAFFMPGLVFAGTGLVLLLASRWAKAPDIGYRDALLFVTLAWLLCGVTGAIPILLIEHVSITDAVFESISGLTTTGATILSGLDDDPRSFLMYRQFLQWLGGLGVVILVVAILPMLNVGGMKLYKAETPGPMKDQKLAPRIAHTARYLWYVYVGLTALCAIAYAAAGMSFYDAVAHSFSTVSTGGFSTHDASIGYFHSLPIELTADLFMLLGAVNFGLHFMLVRRRQWSIYWRDEEARWFFILVLGLSGLLSVMLYEEGVYATWGMAVSRALFHLISFMTSTGFGAGNYADWPISAGVLLVFAAYLGGCVGSTAGGNKIVRSVLSIKMMGLEVKRLVHPQGIFSLRYQGKRLSQDIGMAVSAFMAFAAGSSMLFTLALMATGTDFWSALTAVAACLNVLGPAFGEFGSNFQPLTDTGTWILSFAMIVGRLEYFTVFVLVVPAFWRR